MKIGITSYSLNGAMLDGRLTPLDAITWAAKNGAESFEISAGEKVINTHLPDMPEKLAARAKEEGIELSSYTVGANFIQANDEARAAEVERVKKEVDIAVRLGMKRMRFDAGWRPMEETTLENFEKDLPVVAACCAQVADYANQFGIITSVENHGYHFQGAERVQRLIRAVNRPYYRTTLDVGNFLCADNMPIPAVKDNISLASHLHLKDFIFRPYGNPPPQMEGWLRTRGGNFLRATVVGYGSIDMKSVCNIIRESGYDGFVSVEFEGQEDCLWATRIGLENAKKFLRE